MQEFIVKRKIAIKAEPSAVWYALTNAEKTRKFFFNCDVFSDWRVGSIITFKGKKFLIKKIELKGIILRIEHERLLQYTLKNNNNNCDSVHFSTVTNELTYENGETTLTITDDVGKGEGAEDRYKKSEKDWNKVLKSLKEVVEEGK